MVSQNGSVYINVIPVTSTETFDAAKWSKIGVQNDLFHVTLQNLNLLSQQSMPLVMRFSTTIKHTMVPNQ